MASPAAPALARHMVAQVSAQQSHPGCSGCEEEGVATPGDLDLGLPCPQALVALLGMTTGVGLKECVCVVGEEDRGAARVPAHPWPCGLQFGGLTARMPRTLGLRPLPSGWWSPSLSPGSGVLPGISQVPHGHSRLLRLDQSGVGGTEEDPVWAASRAPLVLPP